MPIITKPATIEKNVAASFSLDKTALAAVASVAADTYFSNSTNWERVLLFYKSSAGKQKEILKFDATQASPTATFLASDKARNTFEIQKILICDFDNGIFEVPRSELTVVEFDVDMTIPPGPTALFTRDFSNASMPSTLDSETVNGSGASIGGGYLNLYAFDSVNRTGYNFDISSSVSGISSSETNVTVRLTLAPSNEAVADMKVSFSGGFQPQVVHTITSQDISNGYIDFSNVSVSNGFSYDIYFNTGTLSGATYLRISKLEII